MYPNLSDFGKEYRNFAFELFSGDLKICSAVETVTDINNIRLLVI